MSQNPIDKKRHDGRIKDPWQVPHQNRRCFKIWFWLDTGERIGRRIAVPPPYEENLKKYRDEVIELNRPDWHRPQWTPNKWDAEGRAIGYGPKLDPATGRQVIKNRLRRVTVQPDGADI